MNKMLFAILILAGLLIACSKEPVQAPAFAPSNDQQEPASPDQNTGTQNSGTAVTAGQEDKITALDIDSVECDLEDRKISFRFANNDAQDRQWQMNQQVSWNGPKDLVAVRVFVNSYEVNGRNQPILSGENLFGPKWPFSENCGGTEVLAPGDDVTCTLQPVPLKAANQLTAGNNEIFIDSPSSHHIIQFTCD
jgi:hypothetical protein